MMVNYEILSYLCIVMIIIYLSYNDQYFLKENHTSDMWGNICVNGTFSFTQTMKEKMGYSSGNPLYYIW